MIQTQKNWILKLKKHKKISIPTINTFSLFATLKSSTKFVLLYWQTVLLWCILNLVLLFLFRYIPGGWTNSLSILWLVSYYIYWNMFFRHILQRQPYFSLIRIFNGLVPVSKIMFINIAIYILLIIIPYIPLLMGFRDKYLEFFEAYMDIIELNNSLYSKVMFYILMLLISPYTIMRPYLAYISSIVGKSRSIMDAYKKTTGYYWRFVGCATIMSAIFVFSSHIDSMYNINITTYLMSFLLVFYNVLFINMYKCFYKRKTKKSFG